MKATNYKQFKEHQFLTTESNKAGSQMIARPFSSANPRAGKIDNMTKGLISANQI